MGEPKRKYEAHPGSSDGDFYRVCDECVSCGVPQSVAPDLIGSTEDGQCFWKKQPETPEELARALDVINGSCVAAHHYAGHDAAIISQIEYSFSCDQVEQPPDPMDSKWFRIWVEILTGMVLVISWIVDLPRRIFRRR